MATDELSLRLCPDCKGEDPARAKCKRCKGAGMFDQDGEPFVAPGRFAEWTPQRLVALSDSRWQRVLATAGDEKPRRMTSYERETRMLHALARGGADYSTVELVKNAKGDTQHRVVVRTGDEGIETIEDAMAKAIAIHDHLRELYPMSAVSTK